MSRPLHPLYFMTKPSPELAKLIWGWSRTDKTRPASLLHVTVLPLVDLAAFPIGFVDRLLDLMTDFEADSFRLVFDRVVERHNVLLCGSEPMRGARRFQASLQQFLRARGFTFFGAAPTPHVTLRYGRDGCGGGPIEPISWQATELLLIESVVGQRRHIEHGRWQLRSDQRRRASN